MKSKTTKAAGKASLDPMVRKSAILHLLDEYIATSEGPTKVTLRAIRYDVVVDLPNAGGQIPPASGGNLDRLVGGSV